MMAGRNKRYSGEENSYYGCLGKWALIELQNGETFPMMIETQDPTGQTKGKVPTVTITMNFPTSSIKTITCI